MVTTVTAVPTENKQGEKAMSYLVLHMDKFKKDAIRGIQSHNRRERESHSNPDIDYSRSVGNYDLHESASDNYSQTIQNRIDDLLMVKAVRKDAVHMCGLIVSSDKSFFTRMGKEETRRFFAEAAAYLTDFVGRENVVSAMVHMDEKTPHMHFLLCAGDAGWTALRQEYLHQGRAQEIAGRIAEASAKSWLPNRTWCGTAKRLGKKTSGYQGIQATAGNDGRHAAGCSPIGGNPF